MVSISSHFALWSMQTNQAPHLSPFPPCTQFQPVGKLYVWTLPQTEHLSTAAESMEPVIGLTVLRQLHLIHWWEIPTPIGHAPGCIHVKVCALADLNSITLVCAPNSWHSSRIGSRLDLLYMKCWRPTPIRNPCVNEGWKFDCEKH